MEDRAHEYDGSHKAATHKDVLFATLCHGKRQVWCGLDEIMVVLPAQK
jgi:hypothetical protein